MQRKSAKYSRKDLGSTVAEDGDLDAAITHRSQERLEEGYRRPCRRRST